MNPQNQGNYNMQGNYDNPQQRSQQGQNNIQQNNYFQNQQQQPLNLQQNNQYNFDMNQQNGRFAQNNQGQYQNNNNINQINPLNLQQNQPKLNNSQKQFQMTKNPEMLNSKSSDSSGIPSQLSDQSLQFKPYQQQSYLNQMGQQLQHNQFFDRQLQFKNQGFQPNLLQEQNQQRQQDIGFEHQMPQQIYQQNQQQFLNNMPPYPIFNQQNQMQDYQQQALINNPLIYQQNPQNYLNQQNIRSNSNQNNFQQDVFNQNDQGNIYNFQQMNQQNINIINNQNIQQQLRDNNNYNNAEFLVQQNQPIINQQNAFVQIPQRQEMYQRNQQNEFQQNQFNQNQNIQNAYNQGFINQQVPKNDQFSNMHQNYQQINNNEFEVNHYFNGQNFQNNQQLNQNDFINQFIPQQNFNQVQNNQQFNQQKELNNQYINQPNNLNNNVNNLQVQQNLNLPQNLHFQNNNQNQILKPNKEIDNQAREHHPNNQMKTLKQAFQQLNQLIKKDDFEKSKIIGQQKSKDFPFVTKDDFDKINEELFQQSQQSRIKLKQSETKGEQNPQKQEQNTSTSREQNIGINLQSLNKKQETSNEQTQSQKKQQQKVSSKKKHEKNSDTQLNEVRKSSSQNENEDIFDIIKDLDFELKIESLSQYSNWKQLKINSQEKFQQIVQIMNELFLKINSDDRDQILQIIFQITAENLIKNALDNFISKQPDYQKQTLQCFGFLTQILVYQYNELNQNIGLSIVQALAANVEKANEKNKTKEMQSCLEQLNKLFFQIEMTGKSSQNNQKQPKSNKNNNKNNKINNNINNNNNSNKSFQDFFNIPTNEIGMGQFDLVNQPQQIKKSTNQNQNPQLYQNQQIMAINNQQMVRQEMKNARIFQNVNYTLPITTKVTPTLNEIVENRYQDFERYLIPIPKKEKFNSIAEYLSVNYYLMREDFFLHPRQFLHSVLNDNKVEYRLFNQDFRSQVYVYCNIRVVNIKFSMENFFVELKAQPMFMENRSCQFSNSKRLMTGSLIIICDQSTKKQLMGLVSYLDRSIDQIYQTRQTVKFGIKIINKSKEKDSVYFNQIIEFLQQSQKNNFFAFEPRNYWQSYSHCLKEIRKMSKDKNITIPFQDIIVGDENILKKPEFINHQTTYKFQVQDRVISFNLNAPWPDELRGTLDDSQFKALQNMLTKQISLIQGPPGTGKTFIGITGVKILLENWDAWNKTNSPILIVCKTNHALDQFLCQILKFEKRIVRIGTRCQQPALKNHLIGKFKPNLNYNLKFLSKQMNQHINLIIKPIDQVHKIKNFLKHYDNFDILDFVCSEFLSMIQVQVYLSEQEQLLIFDRWWRNRFDESIISDISKTNQLFKQQVTNEKKELLKQFFDDRFNAEKKFHEQRKQQSRKKKLQAKEELEKSVNFSQQDSYIIDDNEMDEGLIDNLEFKQIVDSLEYEDYEFNLTIYNNFIKNHEQKGLYMDFEEYMNLKIFGYKKQQQKSIQDLMKQFSQYKIQSKEYKLEKKKYYADILKNNRVAGMTLTGSQMNMDSLRQLQYQIVILEEAGQILETHLIPLLKPGLQQIIMIGDHQQLKPSVQNYQIEQLYNYNQSMLERLISKGVEYVELNTQRRMRREFSNIIRLFYPQLQDHQQVAQYSNVRGMQKNFLFLNHSTQERQMKNRVSMSNDKEAELVVSLVKYILDQNQFNKQQITVLSMYNGQCRLLRQKLSLKLLSEVEVSTVDNYQGEENQIIILSLVRSNEELDIGFLKNSNRINVAFSRAKVGFYVFGNFDMFKKQPIDFWKGVTQYCEQNSFVSDKIQSKCSQHNAAINISLENDTFNEKSPNGGCLSICNKLRNCNHKCQQQCHNGSCEQQICNLPCKKLLPCKHQCKRKCSEKCGGFCNVQVEKTIKSCGHICKVNCGDDLDNFQCKVMVEKIFDCNHKAEVECYKKSGKLYCNIPVQFQSACGNANHRFQIICGLQKIYRQNKICNFEVSKHCDTCNQSGKIQCSRQNQYKCQFKTPKQLMCNHQILVICSEQKTILDQPCEKKCQKILDCKHECTNLCSQKCSKCQKKNQFVSYCCNERMIVSCAYKQATLMEKNQKFPCKCNTNICKRHFKKQKAQYGQQCDEICGEVLPCSHTCKSKCKDCLYGLLHQKCNESVEKTLACGHKATIPCSQSVLYNHCNQQVEFMTCQQNKQNTYKLKCYQKNKINEALNNKFKSCFSCKSESVLTLSCNHDINFPQQYFDYQYSRKPFTIPICKESNCAKQLIHHAFSSQIREAFQNINNIEEQISKEFSLILLNFEEQTKNIQIQNPYGVIENEQRYYSNHENQDQVDNKSSQIIKLRTCILKQIISDFEQLHPFIEAMWIKKPDDTIQIMCQAFKNIENLYFQITDKCRISFYLELHKKMIYFATVIHIHYQNQEVQYQQLDGFPFDPTPQTFQIVLEDSVFQQKLKSFCLDDILKLGKLQLKKCQNNHITNSENQYCDHCYQILQNYEIQFDI
ncbi:hypothetical protein ABPG74_009614 [Tetrahymena malaccensis]